jgi:hypothetical protein
MGNNRKKVMAHNMVVKSLTHVAKPWKPCLIALAAHNLTCNFTILKEKND